MPVPGPDDVLGRGISLEARAASKEGRDSTSMDGLRGICDAFGIGVPATVVPCEDGPEDVEGRGGEAVRAATGMVDCFAYALEEERAIPLSLRLGGLEDSADRFSIGDASCEVWLEAEEPELLELAELADDDREPDFPSCQRTLCSRPTVTARARGRIVSVDWAMVGMTEGGSTISQSGSESLGLNGTLTAAGGIVMCVASWMVGESISPSEEVGDTR
jgi:hypothetical protein